MADAAQAALSRILARTPGETEFHQAVTEVAASLGPVFDRHPEFDELRVLERLAEPDRVIQFRVEWTDDAGRVRLNRGFRVQMSSVIGPYKGGLRFHPSVNLCVLKFLAFEQVLKNALTTLPMGGAKGGSDFDPKGKSDNEVRRFCQSFMTELHRHIGQFTDVPAGDVGVGSREIGYLFGRYKRITNEFSGVITGKGAEWGGSYVRPEATGYGLVYFAQEMLADRSDSLEGKTCLVSGSGNVAQHAVAKLLEVGARVVTMSDSDGFVHEPAGLDPEKLAWIMDLKNRRRGRLAAYPEAFPSASYVAAGAGSVWSVPADCAFPCATQNEIGASDAAALVANGLTLVAEGSNMSTVPDGVRCFQSASVLYGPSKAANAGGVAVSGLEMAQDAEHLQWSAPQVDARLHKMMRTVYHEARAAADDYGRPGDLVAGANIAGFTKVAEAMMAQGVG